MWIINGYHLTKFPWYLTSEESLNDFNFHRKDLLTITVLKYQPSMLPDLLHMTQELASKLVELLTPVSALYIFGLS